MIVRTDYVKRLDQYDGKWRRVFVWGPMRTYDGHWVFLDTVWRRWDRCEPAIEASSWEYRVDLPKHAVVAEGENDEWGDMR